MTNPRKTPDDWPLWPVVIPTALLSERPPSVTIRRADPTLRQPETGAIGQRYVYLDGPHRQRLWSGIQREDPALADLIQSEEVQLIRDLFGADLVLSPEQMRQFMEEGS